MLNKKSIKMVWAFKWIIVLSIGYSILNQPNLPTGIKSLWVGGLFLIQLNDYGRGFFRLLERHRLLYYGSVGATILAIGSYMVQFDSPTTGIYYIFPLVEVFLAVRSLQIGLVLFHVCVYLVGMVLAKADFQNSLLAYFASLLLVYLFRSISLEREKSHLLNVELAEAHAKLKEITIVKERTRIAQEMHDSIGHSLIALRMHLEFAENVMDSQPEKASEAVEKAHHFSQKSIKELRKAVAVLKEPSINSPIALEELIADMTESLQTSGKLTFDLHFDKKVESLSQDLKNSIYNTVREAVTNGIKHGKATNFCIEILKRDNDIHVFVEDNGVGCNQIKKSHGLRGIEERMNVVNGNVTFTSEKDQGFKMKAEIPL